MTEGRYEKVGDVEEWVWDDEPTPEPEEVKEEPPPAPKKRSSAKTGK